MSYKFKRKSVNQSKKKKADSEIDPRDLINKAVSQEEKVM